MDSSEKSLDSTESSEEVAEKPTLAPGKHWSFFQRLLFRFGFSYFLFYNLNLIFPHFPGGGLLIVPIGMLFNLMIGPVGTYLFGMSPKADDANNGSGDTTYSYSLTACHFIAAVIATIIWTIADFKRKNYSRLYPWFVLTLRMALASSMISYGAYKVINTQFPPPHLGRLVETYGESSPMGLLWTFMGSSPAYSSFCGMAEMVGGCLLIFPRLTLIGSLVSFAVMSNVWMLNMCYDVPVKIYSFHLLVMSIILIAPESKRLYNLFFRNQTVHPAPQHSLFVAPKKNNIALGVQIVFGLFVLMSSCDSSIRQTREMNTRKVPFYGIWLVEEETISAVKQTDDRAWHYMIFEWPKNIQILTMDRTMQYYSLELDGAEKNITLFNHDKDDPWKAHFKVTHTDPQHMTLTGDFVGYPAELKLKKVEKSEFLLINRGFHWINEYPFNR